MRTKLNAVTFRTHVACPAGMAGFVLLGLSLDAGTGDKRRLYGTIAGMAGMAAIACIAKEQRLARERSRADRQVRRERHQELLAVGRAIEARVAEVAEFLRRRAHVVPSDAETPR